MESRAWLWTMKGARRSLQLILIPVLDRCDPKYVSTAVGLDKLSFLLPIILFPYSYYAFKLSYYSQYYLVQRHTKPIVHFLIKAPKLVQIYIAILWTFSDIEACEIVPVSAVVGGVQKWLPSDNKCSTTMSFKAVISSEFCTRIMLTKILMVKITSLCTKWLPHFQ